MESDLFGFLNGISPWWWVALSLTLGAIEVMTFTYFLLWPGLAAGTVAVLLFILPSMAGTTQALIFALLTMIYAVVGWVMLRRIRRRGQDQATGLNQRSARLIGRRATVEQSFASGIGWVSIDGERWRARLAGDAGSDHRPAVGAELEVTGAEGMTLVVARTD